MRPPEKGEPRAGKRGLKTNGTALTEYRLGAGLQVLREIQWWREAHRPAGECRRGDAAACKAFRVHRAAMGGRLRGLRGRCVQ